MFVQNKTGLLDVILLHALIDCFAAAAVLEGKWHKEAEVAFLFERSQAQKWAAYLRSCCVFVKAALICTGLLFCCERE